jgi:pimeloyl-ACP methyl ester carboxylesterase
MRMFENVRFERGDPNVTIFSERRTTSYLDVPGAVLHYEVAGAGPVLLLIPGGTADATDFARIVAPLAERYTVASFDPRGMSRSRPTDPEQELSVEVLADDAHRLLAAISAEPAFVFGSSGGGVIGLALAERHPEQVRVLVAHEPPLVTVLPRSDPRRASGQEISDTYREAGAGAAIQTFIAVTGLGGSGARHDPSPELREAMTQRLARMQQNVEFFLSRYLLPITGYLPDAAALQEGSPRVVVGVGETSGGQLAHDTALALADVLGTPAIVFPGDHSGYFIEPTAFAGRLDEVLQAAEQ